MKYIERDTKNFHPESSQAFKHNLCGHPLFELEELKKLALRHPKVRYHSAMIPRSQSLDTVCDDCSTGMSLEETLDNITTSGSFVFIMDVHEDPIYGPLVNKILDEIQVDVEKHHKKLRNRQAWIFITSPGGTTPYHRDQETAHFMHIKGKKKFYLWDQKDREVVSQKENEHFHGIHGLGKTQYKDALMDKATCYDIVPGDGVFFPYTAPHMVENGDEFAISFSVTHMTSEDYAQRRINKINQILRKLGMNPTDLGVSKLKDSFKLIVHGFLRNTLGFFKQEWKES